MAEGKLHRYESDAVVVTWDAGVCIHAAECIRGLPSVFDRNAKPWVRPGAAAPDALEAAIACCPSGALKFIRKGAAEPPPRKEEPAMPEAANVARVSPDGPYVCTGDIAVAGVAASGGTPIELCRCGGSGSKPYCDGSHETNGFKDPGLLPAAVPASTAGAGHVDVEPRPNGPLKCVGPLTLVGADGRTTSADPAFLCRCGHSGNKPFCDGTHRKIGFVS